MRRTQSRTWALAGPGGAAAAFGALFSAALPTPGWSQVAAATTPQPLGEVVVTARRREERIQDVPIAAQALSGQALRNYGIDTASDLTRLAPSLQFSGSFETIPKVTIRGVGTNEFTANVNPAVGLYIDDVYQGLGAGQNFQLFDVGRVEVLRGPQGTLFGKNSTGGAVQYFTADPVDEFGGRIKAGVGRFDLFETEAMANLPLGERAALRVSAMTQTRDGYWLNRTLGARDGELDRWAARAKLKLEPADGVEIVLKAAHGEADDDLRRSRQVGRLPSGVDLTGYRADPQFWQGESDKATFDRVVTTNLSGRVTVDLGELTLTSVTGYDRARRDSFEDADESPYELLQVSYPSRGQAFSQEVRLSGEAGDLTFVAGGFYGRERQHNGIEVSFFDCFVAAACSVPRNAPDLRMIAAAFGVPTDGLSDAQVVAVFPDLLNGALAAGASQYDLDYRLKAVTYAAFAEGTYALTEQLNLTGGLRYTRERRTFFGVSEATGGGALGPGYGFNGIPAADDGKTWDDLSGRVVVDYKPAPDILLYASASRAFRAGNYNGGAFSQRDLALPPVDPESVWSYEAGAKMQLFERRLTLNLAAFYLDFSDKQEFVAENAQILLRNAASARSYGFEADLVWRATPHLTFSGGLALLDAKYRRFESDLGDFSGNRLPNAPRVSAVGTVMYETNLPGGSGASGFVALDVQHRSRVFYQANNDPVSSDDGFTAADLRAGLTSPDRRTSLNLFVNNLFNTKQIVDSNDIGAPFFITVLTENMPRTWGLSIAFQY